MAEVFLRKLRQGAFLSQQDEGILNALARPLRQVRAHRDIVREYSAERFLPLIVQGWACRYRVLENGKRQIISILVPGDLCEPFGALPQINDDPLSTITPVTFVPVKLDGLARAAQSSPAIAKALWWDLLVATRIERELIVSLGRRMAPERTGHLFCELYLRLETVGLVNDCGYEFPLTQSVLADALGLSTVHVNRSLQELRSSGLISLHNRRLTIHNFWRLQELCSFDPTYLHLAGASKQCAGTARLIENTGVIHVS